jgi:hypothetical protein
VFLIVVLLLGWGCRAKKKIDEGKRFNGMKATVLALIFYHDKHERFPYPRPADCDSEPRLSWRVHILPFMEEKELYKQFRLDEPWDSEHNIKLLDKIPDAFKTLSGDTKKTTLLALLSSSPAKIATAMDQMHECYGPSKKEFTDGTFHTVLIIEASPEAAVPWTKPADLEYDPNKPLPRFGRADEDFVMCVTANGEVVYLRKDASEREWRGILTRNGGELVDIVKMSDDSGRSERSAMYVPVEEGG